MTTLAVGLGNPLTILYFTAAMAVGTIPADAGALAVVGVFAGSALWWAALAYAVAALQHHLSEQRLGWARRLTGSAIGGCGLMAVAVAL